jgi:hypothetical protein
MCITFLIIAKDCDTCIQVFGRSPFDRMENDTCIFCLAISCVDQNSLCNIRYPAEWTGVNVPVVFRMKIKISKSRLSLLTSGIICLNLLKNKIFKFKVWSLASENTWKIYFPHNILRFAHQKWQTKKGKEINIFKSLACSNVFSTKWNCMHCCAVISPLALHKLMCSKVLDYSGT